jgi:hypothetical protein
VVEKSGFFQFFNIYSKDAFIKIFSTKSTYFGHPVSIFRGKEPNKNAYTFLYVIIILLGCVYAAFCGWVFYPNEDVLVRAKLAMNNSIWKDEIGNFPPILATEVVGSVTGKVREQPTTSFPLTTGGVRGRGKT